MGLCYKKTTRVHTNTTMLNQEKTTKMASSSSFKSYRTIPILFIFVAFVRTTVLSNPLLSDSSSSNQTLRPRHELQKLNRIKIYLKKVNKPAVKTIQSPDGDLIDCVLSHLQPAFDHPLLKGQKPLEPPERPKGHNSMNSTGFQLWSEHSGETCPEGTIPIRRTTEKDVLRVNSIRGFGRRRIRRGVQRDTMSSDHEHAVAFVNGDQYYGAKASINVWTPQVTDQYEFSLSQLWVISGTFGNDLNTIEAGWQVSPELYGDNYPRFFTYWTVSVLIFFSCSRTYARFLYYIKVRNQNTDPSLNTDGCIPSNRMLQLIMLRLHPNQQQNCYWRSNLSNIVLQWHTI
ncbi:Hypothetical predicted protein [Olea europaea subsp. europaea]|uniref:Neprosin PEP catalytic domain-containing protein n=1 Tax=Olea europaea subsp. europaea TaxID=158383 RepID=A0A8S0UTB0_OLEEU|nr:Hypothetical predicted protein [Olea europaea subsp. europaea]